MFGGISRTVNTLVLASLVSKLVVLQGAKVEEVLSRVLDRTLTSVAHQIC